MITTLAQTPFSSVNLGTDHSRGGRLITQCILEAYEAGLDFDITLTSTQEDGGQIGKEEILKMGDYGIIILEEPVKVETASKILYTSDNVEVLSGKSAKVTETEEAAYLIIK